MKSGIALIPLLSLMLASCAAPSSVKPDVQQYTKAQQKEAAKEMAGCDCPVIWQMLGDFMVMRDQVRGMK